MKIKAILSAILFFSFFGFLAYSQKIEWSRENLDTKKILPNIIISTPDNGCLIFSDTWIKDEKNSYHVDSNCFIISKIDSMGNTIWEKVFHEGFSDAKSIIKASDDNYLILCTTQPDINNKRGVGFILINENGVVVKKDSVFFLEESGWTDSTIVYSTVSSIEPTNMISTWDSGYLVIGRDGGILKHPFFGKWDKSGKLQSFKSFIPKNFLPNQRPRRSCQINDSTFIVFGINNIGDLEYLFDESMFYKINNKCDIISATTFPLYDEIPVDDIVNSSDGNILICGDTYKLKGFFAKITPSGDILWKKKIKIHNSHIIQLENGNIAIIGNNLNKNFENIQIIFFDANGKKISESNLNVSGEIVLRSICKTKGGYFLCGYCNIKSGCDYGGNDGFVIKILL